MYVIILEDWVYLTLVLQSYIYKASSGGLWWYTGRYCDCNVLGWHSRRRRLEAVVDREANQVGITVPAHIQHDTQPPSSWRPQSMTLFKYQKFHIMLPERVVHTPSYFKFALGDHLILLIVVSITVYYLSGRWRTCLSGALQSFMLNVHCQSSSNNYWNEKVLFPRWTSRLSKSHFVYLME